MKQCLQCGSRFSDSGWHCPSCHWEPEVLEGFPAFAPNLISQCNGFTPGAHDELVIVEERCFWFRSRNKLLQDVLDCYFPSAQNLFEIGCGTGFVLSGFQNTKPQMRLVGAEIYLSGLRQAKLRLPRAELLQMDARKIPYMDEFDVVGAFDVLEHIEDDLGVLKEICKALKPDGGIILTVPQHQWLWSQVDQISCHKRRYSEHDLQGKVEAAGFRVLRISSFITLLLPLMVFSRWKYRSKTRQITRDDVLREFKIPSTLDAFFEKICDMERFLFNCGKSFSAGGALLCVGKKTTT